MLKSEYRIRLLTVVCFTLSVVGLLGIAALWPALTRAINEEKNQEKGVIAIQKINKVDIVEAKDKLASDADLLKTLSSQAFSLKYSNIIKSIVAVRGSSSISSFSFSAPDASHFITVSISGKTPNRQELLAFKGRLLNVIPGGSVDFPIGDLVMDKEISYSLTIKWPL